MHSCWELCAVVNTTFIVIVVMPDRGSLKWHFELTLLSAVRYAISLLPPVPPPCKHHSVMTSLGLPWQLGYCMMDCCWDGWGQWFHSIIPKSASNHVFTNCRLPPPKKKEKLRRLLSSEETIRMWYQKSSSPVKTRVPSTCFMCTWCAALFSVIAESSQQQGIYLPDSTASTPQMGLLEHAQQQGLQVMATMQSQNGGAIDADDENHFQNTSSEASEGAE